MTRESKDPSQTAEGYFFRQEEDSPGWMKRIALTGGPSSGKTTALRYLRTNIGTGVAIVPEAATVLLEGGFPLDDRNEMPSPAWRRSFQYAVAMTQLALEHATEANEDSLTGLQSLFTRGHMLCDRGLADGAAYLPGGMEELSEMVNMGREQILGRYGLVIHLTTSAKQPRGYNKGSNPHRLEESAEAIELDDRTLEAWEGHPNRLVLDIHNKHDRNRHAYAAILRHITADKG